MRRRAKTWPGKRARDRASTRASTSRSGPAHKVRSNPSSWVSDCIFKRATRRLFPKATVFSSDCIFKGDAAFARVGPAARRRGLHGTTLFGRDLVDTTGLKRVSSEWESRLLARVSRHIPKKDRSERERERELAFQKKLVSPADSGSVTAQLKTTATCACATRASLLPLLFSAFRSYVVTYVAFTSLRTAFGNSYYGVVADRGTLRQRGTWVCETQRTLVKFTEGAAHASREEHEEAASRGKKTTKTYRREGAPREREREINHGIRFSNST